MKACKCVLHSHFYIYFYLHTTAFWWSKLKSGHYWLCGSFLWILSTFISKKCRYSFILMMLTTQICDNNEVILSISMRWRKNGYCSREACLATDWCNTLMYRQYTLCQRDTATCIVSNLMFLGNTLGCWVHFTAENQSLLFIHSWIISILYVRTVSHNTHNYIPKFKNFEKRLQGPAEAQNSWAFTTSLSACRDRAQRVHRTLPCTSTCTIKCAVLWISYTLMYYTACLTPHIPHVRCKTLCMSVIPVGHDSGVHCSLLARRTDGQRDRDHIYNSRYLNSSVWNCSKKIGYLSKNHSFR